MEGQSVAGLVFRAATLEHYLDVPPTAMVGEDEVLSLHRALHAQVGDARARSIGWIAGQRTGDYLLANRIPRFVQGVLKLLPAGFAAHALIVAIKRNAWTFVGTGIFSVRPGRPIVLEVIGSPLCRGVRQVGPARDFYAGTFERLFSRLVHPQATVVETDCAAQGAARCRFEVRWPH